MLEMTRTIAKGLSMTSEKTWLTCREAGVLLKYSQRHIINLIKKGKVSAQKDEDGKYFIEKSEFFRVYPDAMNVEALGTDEKSIGSEAMKVMEEKIRHLQEMVDEKKKQNEFLAEQLGSFTQEKSKMLDAINSHARLLEFKETAGKSSSPYVDQAKRVFEWWPFKRR